jgi:hypothetical protein
VEERCEGGGGVRERVWRGREEGGGERGKGKGRGEREGRGGKIVGGSSFLPFFFRGAGTCVIEPHLSPDLTTQLLV